MCKNFPVQKFLCVKDSVCKARPLPLSRALPKLFPHLSVHADAYPMLGLSFSLLRCEGSENQASTDRTPCKMKTPPAKNFFPCMSGMSLCPAFRHRLRSLWHQFFRTIALMEFVLRKPCQQLSLPANEAMHVPWPRGLETLAGLGRTIFGNNLSGASVSLPPAEIPSSYFEAIFTLSTPSALVPSCLPSFLARSLALPSRQRKLNENPSIGDAFGKRNARSLNYFRLPTISGLPKPTYITSSTAQGGGGSFKNRKPIGEVGCCESRMAERIH